MPPKLGSSSGFKSKSRPKSKSSKISGLLSLNDIFKPQPQRVNINSETMENGRVIHTTVEQDLPSPLKTRKVNPSHTGSWDNTHLDDLLQLAVESFAGSEIQEVPDTTKLTDIEESLAAYAVKQCKRYTTSVSNHPS